MRYGSLNGGKRLRPFLVVESAALFDVPHNAALLAGAALECIHCYSLIHDDLPSMDNSDLRRGKPTAHKAFDDATAILAGDALLTIAFDIITRDEIHREASVRLALTRALARASGIGGMAGGQMMDLAGEGRFGDKEPPDVAKLQQMKTGALLHFGCIAGALLGQASKQDYAALDTYGRALGEAFQIADDLLDLEGDAATLGKPAGQDDAMGKTTFVTLLGVDGARQRLKSLVASGRFGARQLRRPRRCAARHRKIRGRTAELDDGGRSGKTQTRSLSRPAATDTFPAGPRPPVRLDRDRTGDGAVVAAQPALDDAGARSPGMSRSPSTSSSPTQRSCAPPHRIFAITRSNMTTAVSRFCF